MKKRFLFTILIITIISCAPKYDENNDTNLPNNSFENAYFIKTDGKFVKGSFDASGDVEYYKFYARRYKIKNYLSVYYTLKIKRPKDKTFQINLNYYTSDNLKRRCDAARAIDASSDRLDPIGGMKDGLYYLTIEDYNDEYVGEYEISITENSNN